MGIFKKIMGKKQNESLAAEKQPSPVASLDRTDRPITSMHVPLNMIWGKTPLAGVECLFPIFEEEKDGGYGYVWEALFRTQGKWYLHWEGFTKIGNGGDGAGFDTYLPMVTNENAAEWAEKRKAFAPMTSFSVDIGGRQYFLERLPEGQIHASPVVRTANDAPGQPDITLPADYLPSHSAEQLYLAIAGQNAQPESSQSAAEVSRLQDSLRKNRWIP